MGGFGSDVERQIDQRRHKHSAKRGDHGHLDAAAPRMVATGRSLTR